MYVTDILIYFVLLYRVCRRISCKIYGRKYLQWYFPITRDVFSWHYFMVTIINSSVKWKHKLTGWVQYYIKFNSWDDSLNTNVELNNLWIKSREYIIMETCLKYNILEHYILKQICFVPLQLSYNLQFLPNWVWTMILMIHESSTKLH